MQISERRRKILDIFEEKEPLSYGEILGEASLSGEDPIEILSDLDTLVFFRFLQKEKTARKSEPTSETQLEIRPNTKEQMTDDPSRVFSRIKRLEREIPSWYRKTAILRVLTSGELKSEEIIQTVNEQFPHVRWHPSLVNASLRILKKKRKKNKKKYVFITEQGHNHYALTSDGKDVLTKDPIQQVLCLRKLKDEFNNEFRAYEILKLVVEYDRRRSGISSGKIAGYLRSEYGIRGNKRRAIKNTLENMVLTGLLMVLGGTEKKGGHVYRLGPTVNPLFVAIGVNGMKIYHAVQDFKETIEEFFENCEIPNIKKDVKSRIEQILYDLKQCKQDLSLRSPEEWVEHIMFLSDHLKRVEGESWEKRIFPCIIACILSRLLPATVSVKILEDYPLPSPPSKELCHYYNGIAREYYFNLTDAYLTSEKNEEAFHVFDRLEPLCWESFDFLILKGTIEMRKCNIRDVPAVHKVLETFEKALKKSEGRERIAALFYIGLTHYKRGDFAEAAKVWEQCMELERILDRKAFLCRSLANAYRASGKLEDAKKLCERSIALAETVPDEMEESRLESLLCLANILIDLGSWEEAEEILKEIIEKSTGKGIVLMVALAKTNLGVLLTRKGKYEAALACHAEALELVDREFTQEYSSILINKGDALRYLKRTDDAVEAIDEALELMGSGNLVIIQAAELSKADLYYDTGNMGECLELSNAVFNERWVANRRSEAEAQRIRGKVYLHRNELQKAEKSLKESEKIFNELNLKYELLEVYELLETYYEKLKAEEQVSYYRNEKRALEQLLGLSE